MPSWVKDEDIWKKAEKAAEKSGARDKYAVVTEIYKKMGGEIKGKDLADRKLIKSEDWKDPTRQ
jgi:hypothetical protein